MDVILGIKLRDHQGKSLFNDQHQRRSVESSILFLVFLNPVPEPSSSILVPSAAESNPGLTQCFSPASVEPLVPSLP